MDVYQLPDRTEQVRQAKAKALAEAREDYLNAIAVALIDQYEKGDPEFDAEVGREIARIEQMIVHRTL
jgi:hypothetical protein